MNCIRFKVKKGEKYIDPSSGEERLVFEGIDEALKKIPGPWTHKSKQTGEYQYLAIYINDDIEAVNFKTKSPDGFSSDEDI